MLNIYNFYSDIKIPVKLSFTDFLTGIFCVLRGSFLRFAWQATAELENSREGLELLLLTRQLFEKILGTECYGYHSDLCFIDMECVKIANNIGEHKAAMDFFDSAFEHYTKFEQWKNGKIKKWEERNDEGRETGNSGEHFTSSLLRYADPSGHKVIVCERGFLEKAVHTFPQEKKKMITENPKYSCIFNC